MMDGGDGAPRPTPPGLWGTIGPLVGLGLAIMAGSLTVAILYKANGEQHAVGPAFDGGIVLIVTTPIFVSLGMFVGRRLDRRRMTRKRVTAPVPPRPD